MKSRNTEIISVGTELLLGHVTNTDARDLAEELSKIGINVLYQTVVGDNPGRIKECIENAKRRADIIITTGGLGPTCDDLTKQMLAEAFSLELRQDDYEYSKLEDFICARGRKLTDNFYIQSMIPEGAEVFHNSCGTAPGCAFCADGKIVAMLPGPPKECLAMIRKSLIPYLKEMSDEVIVSHTVNIFGLGESRVDDIFRDKMNSMSNPSMAPYAKECDCFLKITAKAKSVEECEEMIAPHMKEVIDALGDFVYGTDVDNLETAVNKLLADNGRTVFIIEKGTGGAVCARLTAVEGSEKVFSGALIDRDGDIASDIILYVILDGDSVHIKLKCENDEITKDAEIGSDRSRSFIRQMAGNYAFDTVRRYLCRV